MSSEYEGLLEIDALDLEGQFRKCPALIYRFAALEADAQQVMLTAKAQMEQAEARAYGKQKSLLTAKGKPTVDEVKAAVTLDPEFVAAQTFHITAETNARKLKGMVTALLSKRDMLVQLGSNQRAQLQAGMETVGRKARG